MIHASWSTILLGGCRSEDGLFDFQRPVLFSAAVQHMARALPDHWSAVYVHAPDEEGFDLPSVLCEEGEPFLQRLCAAELPNDGMVLVCTVPVPTVERAELEKLQRMPLQYPQAVIAVSEGRKIAAAAFRAETLHTIIQRNPQSLMQAVIFAEQAGDKRVEYLLDSQHPTVVSASSAYAAQQVLQQRKAEQLMARGVTLLDPCGTWIAPDAELGTGTIVLPGSLIYPGCTVGRSCTIGPDAVLEQAIIGDRTTVNASQIRQSRIGADSTVGPYAYIRPDCTVGDRVKIGDFVELKNAVIGDDTMASHLTYIGDAEVGSRVNFGCGTVVVNYDGVHKHRTTIGDDCFIGCNTNLVAPIQIGDRAFTAAGSTVTDSVPDGALAIARARQQTKCGWNDRRRAQHRKDDSSQR